MFSGIGGFELGIRGALPQAECVGYSEIDKHAILTYESHFKHTNYGDATTIAPERLPDFDLLVGGFPCQAFSVAGKRLGFNETRGTLFFDVARILKHKRPQHLVLENVKGLLSHDNGKTFQTILRVLTDLGYHVEWQVLNSKDFGVPQNRERTYIVGHFGNGCGRQVLPLRETDGANQGAWGAQGQVSRTLRAHQGGVDIDDQLVAIGKRIRRLTPSECERLQGFPDNWTLGSDTQRYKQCGNAVTVNVVAAVIHQLSPCLLNTKEQQS